MLLYLMSVTTVRERNEDCRREDLHNDERYMHMADVQDVDRVFESGRKALRYCWHSHKKLMTA